MTEADRTDLQLAHGIERAFERSGVREASLSAVSADPRLAQLWDDRADGAVVAALDFCFEARAKVLIALIDDDLANFMWSEVAPSNTDCLAIAERAGHDAWGGRWPSLWTEWSALAVRHDHVRAHRSRLERTWAERISAHWRDGAAVSASTADHMAWLSLASQALPGLETSGALGEWIGRAMRSGLLEPRNWYAAAPLGA